MTKILSSITNKVVVGSVLVPVDYQRTPGDEGVPHWEVIKKTEKSVWLSPYNPRLPIIRRKLYPDGTVFAYNLRLRRKEEVCGLE